MRPALARSRRRVRPLAGLAGARPGCLRRSRLPAVRRSAARRPSEKTTRSPAPRNPISPRSPKSSKSIPTIRKPTTCAVRCLARPAQSEQALADFNKAISLDPKYAQAYANRGLLYRQDQQARSRARRLQQGAVDRRRLRARLSRPRHRLPPARPQRRRRSTDFNKAIALQPDNAQAYYDRGLLYQSQHQHQFAIDDFTTALGLDPAEGRTARRPRAELSGGRRRQVGGERSRPRRCRSRRQTCKPGPAVGSPTNALAQKDKAAGSYAKALNINDKYEPAKTGFARVGGKVGQSYQTF